MTFLWPLTIFLIIVAKTLSYLGSLPDVDLSLGGKKNHKKSCSNMFSKKFNKNEDLRLKTSEASYSYR